MLVGILLGLISASIGLAGDSSLSRKTLKGITALSVVIEDLGSKAPDGLTQEQLQTDVELKLRMAGIHVSPPDEPGPYLYVQVTSDSSQNLAGRQTGYFYNVNLEFRQLVFLQRNKVVAVASTWGLEGIGISGPGMTTVQTIRDLVGDTVDKFMNAYLSVNPKH